MRVVWSNRALRSLADIHTRVSADSEDAANRTADRILKRGDQLAAFPLLGRVVDRYKRPGIRELVEAPYRILYRVRRETIEIDRKSTRLNSSHTVISYAVFCLKKKKKKNKQSKINKRWCAYT